MNSWDPESSPAFWINRTSRALLRIHEARLRPLGFGMSQLPVLVALEENGALSQKDLAERAHVEQPTMAEMLSRLQRDGIVERQANPKDGRSSLVSLSKRSTTRLPKAKELLMQGERDAMAGFSKKEKARFMEMLQRVVKNLDDVEIP